VSPCMDVYHDIYVAADIAYALIPPFPSSVPRCMSAGTKTSPISDRGQEMADLTGACLPACYASYPINRRDGWVPAFTRMLSNTMTLDEMWWFLDIYTRIHIYLSRVPYITLTSLWACYYPVLAPVPFSCVRPREAI
jgi:hypothetical protein